MSNELMHIPPQWAWMSLGLLLGIAEIIAPGFYLIWIGLAAIITGAIAFLGINIPLQFVIFAVLTVEGSLASRNHLGGTSPEQVRAAIARARSRQTGA